MLVLRFFSLFFIVLNFTSHASLAEGLLCHQIFNPPTSGTGIFARGSSSVINMNLLRNHEAIEASVLKALEAALLEAPKVTRRASQARVIEFIKRSSETNKTRLYQSLEGLVALAIRPIAHRIKDVDQFEDIMQAGRIGLLKSIDTFLSLDLTKVESLFYWDQTLHYTRARIFTEMRLELRRGEEAVYLTLPKNPELGFREALYLFGTDAKAISDLAKQFDKTPTEAMAEMKSIEEALLLRLATHEASVRSSEDIVRPKIDEQKMKQQVRDFIFNIQSPRARQIVVSYIFEGKTFAQIAEGLNLSTTRIVYIYNKAILKLKHPTVSRHLKPIVQVLDNQSYGSPAKPREYWDPMYRKLKEQERIAAEILRQENALAREVRHKAIKELIHNETIERVRISIKLLKEKGLFEILGITYPKTFKEAGMRVRSHAAEESRLDYQMGFNLVRQYIEVSQNGRPWTKLAQAIKEFNRLEFYDSTRERSLEDIEDLLIKNREDHIKYLNELMDQFNEISPQELSLFRDAIRLENLAREKAIPIARDLMTEGLINSMGFERATLFEMSDLKKVATFFQLRRDFFDAVEEILGPLNEYHSIIDGKKRKLTDSELQFHRYEEANRKLLGRFRNMQSYYDPL